MAGLCRHAVLEGHCATFFLRLVWSKRASYWAKSRRGYSDTTSISTITRSSNSNSVHLTHVDSVDSLNRLTPATPPKLHRFYVHPECNLKDSGPGTFVHLSKEESQHATRTLRLKPGNYVELCDGQGITVTGELVRSEGGSSLRDKKVVVQLVTVPTLQPVDPWHWTVAVGCGSLKGGRADWLVEKATELGAAALLPLSTARSPISESSKSSEFSREGRWRRVANAAMKQCLRAYELTIQPSTTISELCESTLIPRKSLAWVASQWCDAPAAQAFEGTPDATGSQRSGILIIGPEGDFTENELKMMMAAGARAVNLGPLRLRTETAAIAMLSFARLLHVN